jgi:hypothetical protein
MIDIVAVENDRDIICFQMWLSKCRAKYNPMSVMHGKRNFTNTTLKDIKTDISLKGVESLTCFSIQQMELTFSDISEYDVYTRQIDSHGLQGLNINLQALELSMPFFKI